MYSLREARFTAAKRVLRYIKGTNTLRIFFSKSTKETLKLIDYTDRGWGSYQMIQKNTFRYIFSLETCFF